MLDIVFGMSELLVRIILFLLLCILIAVIALVAPEVWKTLIGDPRSFVYEAECRKCHERFWPPDKFHTLHVYTEHDELCGGIGKIIGQYPVPKS